MMLYYITMLGGFLQTVFDLILPPRRTEQIVTALTIDDLHSLQSTGGLPYHAEEVAALVWELKYYGNKRAAALAGELLAEELLAIASEELGPPLLIPIPMHKIRLRERGHNQTELLCRVALGYLSPPPFPEKKSSGPIRTGRTVFSEKGGSAPLDYAPQVLIRIVNTPHQQMLERSKRLHNVKNSMEVTDTEKVRGRVCIVVDDVTTTGATLAEAARALKAAGALRVHRLALAQS